MNKSEYWINLNLVVYWISHRGQPYISWVYVPQWHILYTVGSWYRVIWCQVEGSYVLRALCSPALKHLSLASFKGIPSHPSQDVFFFFLVWKFWALLLGSLCIKRMCWVKSSLYNFCIKITQCWVCPSEWTNIEVFFCCHIMTMCGCLCEIIQAIDRKIDSFIIQ